MPDTNKRDYTRVFTHVDAEVTVEGKGPAACTVDNVSLSGVMLEGGHDLDEGANCTVRLILRGAEPPVAIAAHGRILRVRPDRCAIEFSAIDDESYEHLRKLVLVNAADAEPIEEEFDASVGIKKRHDEF